MDALTQWHRNAPVYQTNGINVFLNIMNYYPYSDLVKLFSNPQSLYKDGAPGYDRVKGGLSMENFVEVDLEKNSQSAQPIFPLRLELEGIVCV